MDAVDPSTRIAVAVITFAILLLVLAAIFVVVELRDRRREAEAKKIREGDRAFVREMVMLHCDAIRSESLARAAAEEQRLYRRSVG